MTGTCILCVFFSTHACQCVRTLELSVCVYHFFQWGAGVKSICGCRCTMFNWSFSYAWFTMFLNRHPGGYVGPSTFLRAIMSVAIDRSWKHCSHDQRIQPRRRSFFGREVSLTCASLQEYVGPTLFYRLPLTLPLHWTWKYHWLFYLAQNNKHLFSLSVIVMPIHMLLTGTVAVPMH